MKGMIPIKNYSSYNNRIRDHIDYKNIYASITPLTRIGIIIFVIGKIFGIIVLPTIFIPSLQILAIPLIICWAGCVITTIVICSYDHYNKLKSINNNEDKIEQIKKWMAESPQLKDQIFIDTKKIKI